MNNISLRSYFDWEKLIAVIFLMSGIATSILSLSYMMMTTNGLITLVVYPLNFFLFYGTWKLYSRLKSSVREKNFLRDQLIYFIKANHLYEEEYREVYDKGKIIKERYIKNSAVFSYEIVKDTELIIRSHKKGDALTKRLQNLDIELESLLGIPLEMKLDKPSFCEYHFYLIRPERLIVGSTNAENNSDSLSINLGYGVVYDPVKTPHILVSGGTGSGKSIFMSFLILELLKRNNKLYICDPKNSDLGSLSHYMGSEKVATTPNNIAKVLRTAVEEMNARYTYMNENFKYGSNFVDHGYKATWVIFDEMGAFQASGTDKNSKETVNEVMAYLKQIILLGRQAGVFVLIAAQQVRAETISTDLRDNLGMRIALGANSSEGYRMVFGSATPEQIPAIEVKGSGLLYLQGSGKESAQYWESPYVDLKEFDFIGELTKYH